MLRCPSRVRLLVPAPIRRAAVGSCSLVPPFLPVSNIYLFHFRARRRFPFNGPTSGAARLRRRSLVARFVERR